MNSSASALRFASPNGQRSRSWRRPTEWSKPIGLHRVGRTGNYDEQLRDRAVHIGEERFDSAAQHLAELAGQLARTAVDGASNATTGIIIAGSLPPLVGSYLPERFDASSAARIIDPLNAGQSPFVDIWLGETLGSIAEARAVRAALDRAGDDRELWIAYTLSDAADGTLRSGENVANAVHAAVDLGAAAVLFNCSQAESISAAIAVMAPLMTTGIRSGGYANRFPSAHTTAAEANAHLSGFRDDLSPVAYADVVAEWLSAGASVVGGCCGMTPDHIAAIRRLADPRDVVYPEAVRRIQLVRVRRLSSG